ncbi:hypothetical protein, partial [Bradyrhizobium sp.]|uniref:hypothetical protein n=1 Tax=Bradyrhizobium sp. TaxID=376 RepID=UPI0025BBBA69
TPGSARGAMDRRTGQSVWVTTKRVMNCVAAAPVATTRTTLPCCSAMAAAAHRDGCTRSQGVADIRASRRRKYIP